MMRIDAKTTQKGRVTIPEAVRKVIGLAPGGLLQFIIDKEGTVWLEAAPSKPDGRPHDSHHSASYSQKTTN